MGYGTDEQLDGAELLAEELGNLLDEGAQAGMVSSYQQGRNDYFEAAIDAIHSRDKSEMVRHVLASAAEDLGYAVDESMSDDILDDEYAVGVLSAWSYSQGMIGGIVKGAEVVAEVIDEVPGVDVEFGVG